MVTYQHSCPQAVLAESQEAPPNFPVVQGWDFNRGNDLDGMLGAMLNTGFQATSLGQAVNEVNRMVRVYGCMKAFCSAVDAHATSAWSYNLLFAQCPEKQSTYNDVSLHGHSAISSIQWLHCSWTGG